MKILTAYIFIVAINMLLFLGQYGVTDIATSENITGPVFYNYEGSFIQDFDKGNFTLDEDTANKLPTGTGQIEPETGNFFTDTFTVTKNWLLETTGLNYLLAVTNGFPNFLKSIGLPTPLAYVIGVFWHSIGLFLFVMLLRGNV